MEEETQTQGHLRQHRLFSPQKTRYVAMPEQNIKTYLGSVV